MTAMIPRCLASLVGVLAMVASVVAGRVHASASEAAPPLDDLLKAVREHVGDPVAPERAAARALLEGVQGSVLEPGEPGEPASDAPAIARTERLEAGPLYVRVGQVSLALAPQLSAILRDTNLVANANGFVLDLRFATGTEYAAAAGVADLFAEAGAPLLDWGNGQAKATPKAAPWELPVAVLVNHETRGAAEALAAAIRSAHAGLIIGAPTAGKAAIFREVALANGQRLRLATSPVRTGDGALLGPEGLQPDVAVRTVASQERALLDNPYAVLGPSSGPGAGRVTNSISVKRRVTEADLVRQRKGEKDATPDETAVPAGPGKVIRDPALARAVDLLKGLALLKASPRPRPQP
jgi:hypothetical protein